MYIVRHIMLVAAIFVLAGCGPVLSKDTLGRMDRVLSLEEVIKSPDA